MKDITKQRLTLIEKLDEHKMIRRRGVLAKGARIGLYQCECGQVVKKPISQVVNGDIRSCGCLAKDIYALKNKTRKQKEKINNLTQSQPGKIPYLLIENMLRKAKFESCKLSYQGLVAKYRQFYCCNQIEVGQVIRQAIKEVLTK